MKPFALLPPRPAWMDHAACATATATGLDLWHEADTELTQHAIRVCRQCPVIAQCLDYALRHHERLGVWGGLTPQQRHRLTANAVKAVAA